MAKTYKPYVKKNDQGELEALNLDAGSLDGHTYEDIDNKKLDKIEGTNQVYTNDESGVAGTTSYSKGIATNTIAMRNESGQLKSADPNDDSNDTTVVNTKTLNIKLSSKQDKLVAGDNITIDPETNIISATGGGSSEFCVKTIKVGTVTYNPVNGIVALPAYPEIPTNVSAFTNDAGYLTSHQDISGKQDKIFDKSSDGKLTTTSDIISVEVPALTVNGSAVVTKDNYNNIHDISTIYGKMGNNGDGSIIEFNGSFLQIWSKGDGDEDADWAAIQLHSSYSDSSIDLMADVIKSNGNIIATENYVNSQLSNKQDAISDLDTIRSNASAGATKISNVQSDWNATSGLAVILNKPTSLPASDVYDWAKSENKPTYTASEVGAKAADWMPTASEVGARPNTWMPTASDIGLGNVGNFKAVSTVANQGLTDSEKANARANIGAGSSSFSGNYNDLTNKPTNVSAFTNDAGYLTSHQDISGKLDKAGGTILGTLSVSGEVTLSDTLTLNGSEIRGADSVETDTLKVNFVYTKDNGVIEVNNDVDMCNTDITNIKTISFANGTSMSTAPVIPDISGKANKVSQTGGTYTKVTVNSEGVISSGSNPTTLSGYGITDAKIENGIITLGSISITPLTSHQDISGKLDKKPNGTNDLIVNNKVSNTYLPDYLLGQVVYGGTVNASGVATLSNNAKSKLGTTSATITLTNNTAAITGYVANEGIYYIATAASTFAGLDIQVGDWLISNGSAWGKVDNTDAVKTVKIGNTSYNPADGIISLPAYPDISGKQDTISDLATIRSNASAGAAKVSNVQADWNATSGLAVILNKPAIPTVPTNVSAFTNDAGYLIGDLEKLEVSLKPKYHDNIDLGSSTKQWRNAYIAEAIYSDSGNTTAEGKIIHYKMIQNSTSDDNKIIFNTPSNSKRLYLSDCNISFGSDKDSHFNISDTDAHFTMVEVAYDHLALNTTNRAHIGMEYNINMEADALQFKSNNGSTKFEINNVDAILKATQIDLCLSSTSATDPHSLNRIKIGGAEVIKTGADSAESIIFAYKPANQASDALVPFAIALDGKAYYNGTELANKNDINGKLDKSKITLSADGKVCYIDLD